MTRENWVEAILGEVCNVNMGQSPPSSTYNTDKKGLPFFQGNAEFTDLYPVALKWCDAPRKTAQKSDILLSVRAPVGATNIANQKCAIGRGLAAISYNFCYKYVFFYLRLTETKLDSLGTGTTFRAISGKIIKSYTIPLAPLPEQRAIVAKIEQLFNELDNSITHLKAAKEKLDIYRQSVLKTAFEGKLPSGKKDNPSSIVPEGWRQETISAVCEVNPPKPVTDDEAEITFLPMSSVEEETGKYCSTGTKRYEQVKSGYTGFLKGDVLFAKITPCMENGKIALIDKLPSQIGFGSTEFHVVRPSKEINEKYLFYFLVQRRLRSFAKREMTGSAGQLRVPKSFLQNLRISFPPIPEQRAIVSAIESRFAVCDKLAQSIDEALEKSQAMRQSILKKAFDGELLSEAELRECRKQPDWEPAEKLLQRIRESRPPEPVKRKK